MKLAGVCPACEMHVEFVSLPGGNARVYKCSNCWHFLDDHELVRAQSISDKLADLERERLRIISGS
jgi:hypothetical protein